MPSTINRQLVAALLTLGVFAGSSTGAEIQFLPQLQTISIPADRLPDAFCRLQNHSDTIATYYSGIAAGERYATYMNPARCAPAPQYPFEIRTVPLSLYTFIGANWPVRIEIEIWMATGGDSCQGPGALLYSEPLTLDQATYGLPNVGVIVLAQSVCVTGPFFVSIRYTGESIAPYPSVMFDNHMPADSCMNWGYGPTTNWDNWRNFWVPPIPGNLIVWVEGETGSSTCNVTPCCVGNTGNVDCDPLDQVDISDLTRLVDYLYVSFEPLCCTPEANTDGQPGIDISDLSWLVDYLYVSFAPLSQCQ